MTPVMASYLDFWGKAGGARDGGPPSHPAAYHGLDVAAAADALLRAHPRVLARLAHLLATTEENARRCLVALIALHDIGKFSDAFQGKVPDAWPHAVLGPYREQNQDRHHTVVALDLFERLDLSRLLSPAFDRKGWDEGLFHLWSGIACHHGKPMEGASETGAGIPIRGMSAAGCKAALAFAADVARLLGPCEPLGLIEKGKAEALSWLVAGLTNLADWIGSDRGRFPYCAASLPLETYWCGALERADAAVSAAGLAPVAAAQAPGFSSLFPDIATPSHLQAWAQSVPLPPGPLLAVIEDVTGSGKTEAALLLAARLMAADRAGGVYFALPTMATANAMFERLCESYGRMFDAGQSPSLVLAHGRSGLHDGFTSSILTTASSTGEREAEQRGDGSSAACSAWIADDRRKAFLAHVGAGTIDQAFLGVLPARYQALRLWGLADRVLIVDEAHAYDAYMGRELERLLEFQAALGGTAIVLSATLPGGQRTALGRAFARGLGVDAQPKVESPYPLATIVSAAGAEPTTVPTRTDRIRRLPVRAMAPGEGALAYISEAAVRGAAVAWIRNSVDDAIEASEALRGHGLEPVLLHARFAMGDRLTIERRVRETLGKSGDVEGRRGFVLVGTQILEQSLDYDVDAMVTDLAPIDLVIQRAGRLWRHSRAGRPVESPELIVVTPDWKEVADRDWYGQVSRRAAAVYKHHGLVWRSAKALTEAGAIETPGGVRALIEAVYGSGVEQEDDVPVPLRRASNDAAGAGQAQKAHAESNLLKVRSGYSGNNTLWTADTITPTRLGDPVTVFRLGRVEGSEIVPWCSADDADRRRSWALSEVSLSQRKAIGVPKHDAATEAMIERAKATWSEWEREQPLLLLDGDREAASGAIVDKDGRTQPVAYGRTASGLRILPA